MKRNILLILISIAFILAAHSQTPTVISKEITKQNGPAIKFDSTSHDFGIIPYNGPGNHIYVVTNVGTEPLIIYNCIKGCGCTNVEWTKSPIMPGQRGFVSATYNTRKIGSFSRGVDVYSNDPNNVKINIRLKGEVLVVPGGEAPPIINNSKTTDDKSQNITTTKW